MIITPTHKIWLSVTLVLSIGLGISLTIQHMGKSVYASSETLLNIHMPRLALIKQLRAALNEHERLLYEYYATANRRLIWPKVNQQKVIFDESLNHISKSYTGHIMDLPDIAVQLQTVSQSLDKNLGSSSIDWDQARTDLEALTQFGQAAEVILVQLTESIENATWAGGVSTQQKSNQITQIVIVFSVLMMLMALYVGYFTQQNIRKSAKRKALAKFPERNPNPVMNLNWQGKILFSNPACQELLARINDDSQDLTTLLPENFLSQLKEWQGNKNYQVQFESTIKPCILRYSLSLLPDLESCHLYIEDVTQARQDQQQLSFQAFHDLTTGLANRRKFEDDLSSHLHHHATGSLLFISIDRFKLITSSQGYYIGDLLINFTGQKLAALVVNAYSASQLYRLDGPTFCIILQKDDPLLLAATIQNAMEEAVCVNSHNYYLNVSMGVCYYPKDGDTLEQLIANGHSTLNRARIHGDCIEQFTPDLHSQQQSWLPIETGMRNALEHNQFRLHYQAKVAADSGKIMGAEALIRWQEDNGKMISPGHFIPVAEQTGLIIKIGQWVIEEGFRQAKLFEINQQSIQLAINISARQFQHRHFLSHLKQALQDSHVNPQQIELEITESLIMENAQQSIQIMKALKDMGFRLAIDDFGTGYSSLSYLKQFPIDILKIDQAFVRNLHTDSDDQSIVNAIIDLAKHLNLKTIAEGVETYEQWQFLKAAQCDYIQGYYFSKPNVAEQLFSLNSVKP